MKFTRAMLLAATLAAGATVQAQEPVRIGFMAELSGPQGVLGQEQYDGFMLAVERNGGKLGGVPVQVFREDSQLKPEVAVQLAQKLIEKEKVSIITGITFSNIMMAVHKPITDKQVFLIGSNAGPGPIAGAQCSPYGFVVSWQNDVQSEVVGKYAADKGFKKVFALAPNYQAGKDYIAGFKRYYKSELAGETYTPLNQQDFSAEISQIAAAKPDAVFVFYPGGLGINFVRQYQQAGLMGKIPLLSTGTTDGSTLPALREAALGAITGSFWGPEFDNPQSKRFVEEFETKHKRIPSQYAAQGYDSAMLLDSAIAKVRGNVGDKPAFTAAIKAADFKSVRGPFKFNHNNFPVMDMPVLQVAKDARGRMSLKTVDFPLRNHEDAYHRQCPLK
ncbi:ABC transporter substrate-binding protein [Ramlibacter sp. 2FC]|uniref:ABC transporter substrate-binding protein n=1 Tax=Ramlibacter sp. 2FC TaxID=2502188 RepID=UPI0010FA040F|nr:ABC transporter substrate-binding protein [Ramlibacter sp. 2FC]